MKKTLQPPKINLEKCPFCSRISFLLKDSGIGNFKKGGTCTMGECQECGYKTIIG
jgi:hypothetical protein